MTVIHVADGGPFDLAGLALRLALDLATSGEDVRVVDARAHPPTSPLDALGLAPHHAARVARHAVTIDASSDAWIVGPVGLAPDALDSSVPNDAPLRFVDRPRTTTSDAPRTITPWRPLDPAYLAPPATSPGEIDATGLALPSTLWLVDPAGDACTPDLPVSRAIAPESLRSLLAALAHQHGTQPEIVLDVPALSPALLELARALAGWRGGWRLTTREAPDLSVARELAGYGCTRVDLAIPAPSDALYPAWTNGGDPDEPLRRLVAAAAAVAARVVFLAGLPGEATREQREALRRLKSAAHAVAAFSARPFAPRPGSPAALAPAGSALGLDHRRYVPGEGPHGWLVGHNNDAWRRKLAREYQIAAESFCISLADPLPLGRDFVRHKAQVARRLTDPFDGAPALVRDNLELVGVLQGERAYAGPSALEIDLTNDCNNTCVGCWCHSLQMGELKFAGAMKRQFLETAIIEKLLDDAWAMGTRKVQLAGSGEPFMHPDVMRILAHAKRLGYEVTIVTNLNFITRERADKLVELGVDRITASVWAGTAATYVATHPNQTEKSFERLRDVLGYLWARKRALGRSAPLVKMYHVVSSVNCRDLEPMVALAVETGCEQVELQITDIVPGRSDSLALSDADRAAVIEQLGRIAARAVDPTRTAARGTSAYAALDSLAEARQFGKFEKPMFPGWTWGDPLLETIYCPRGKEGSLPVRDFCDATETRYHYFWSVWDCHRCPDFATCPVDKTHLAITKEFTELVGFGSFYRRVASMRATAGGEVRYEEQIVDRIPCTIGWTYSRVRVSGEVIPCCKGHLHPLGDLHHQSFADIWYGPTTDELRRMGKHQAKAHPYFSRIRCYAACDNVGHNLATANRLAALTPSDRALLAGAAPDRAYAAPPGEFLLPRASGQRRNDDAGVAAAPQSGEPTTPAREVTVG